MKKKILNTIFIQGDPFGEGLAGGEGRGTKSGNQGRCSQGDHKTTKAAATKSLSKVLADLKGILVRGTVSKTMQETMLRKVMMDIAVPEPTGGPPATGLEECRWTINRHALSE